MDSATFSNSASRDRSSPLASPRVLITAGPTHEPIDRVRYIGNRSSGRMGLALAEECLKRAWPVTLLLGPTAINPPQHSQLITHRFRTAADLQRLLYQHWPAHDLLLMAAAVADFTVADASHEKIKRADGRMSLELLPMPDLLASLAPLTRPDQTVVGFALEPQATLAAEAVRKLAAKRVDAIVANPLETMESPDITATLHLRDGRSIAAPSNISKPLFAGWLLDQLKWIRE